jgi:hypothetical protein
MTVLRFALSLFFLSFFSPGFAQDNEPLSKGPFNVGYRVLSLPYFNSDHGSDTIQLVLNIWYPTEKKSGTRMLLLDYLHFHKRLLPPAQYQIFVDNEIQDFKKFTERNFGTVDPTRWRTLSEKTASAYLDAPYSSKAFPLITGRLRAFSTTYTNEFLASNGYIICMINGVEDFPPDNRPLYHRQISKEIEYYDAARSYLSDSLKIATSKAGLMGFSGGGFSQFFLPMHQNSYDAVALLESGIFLDGDLFDIVSSHPYYDPRKFNTALLFFYNKYRLESNKSSKNFFELNTAEKFLVLFNDSTQHHWDFATEGITSALLLNNRPKTTANSQIKNFTVMNDLLLRFFDRFLKGQNDFKLSPTSPITIGPQGM